MSIVYAGIDITKDFWPWWDATVVVVELLPFLSLIIIIAGIATMIYNKKSRKKYPYKIIIVIGVLLMLFALLAYFTLTVI